MLPTTRENRFWIVGLFLIVGNAGMFAYLRISGHEPLRVLDAAFHLAILLVGLSLLDRELALAWFGRLSRTAMFWRKGGDTADHPKHPPHA